MPGNVATTAQDLGHFEAIEISVRLGGSAVFHLRSAPSELAELSVVSLA
jgi:hypothetical protein